MILIIRGHIFYTECNCNSLRFSRLKQICFCKLDQICRRFLNSPICIWRFIIHFYYIFSGNISGVGYFYIYRNLSVFFLQFTHFLFKFRVTQTISKWILYSLIVINRTFLCSCFIVLVSYINTFHIIGKCRSIHLRSSCVHSFNGQICQICILRFFCIIPPRSSRHIINKCIRCFSGRIDFT